MIEEGSCNCSKPRSFQTVGESIGWPVHPPGPSQTSPTPRQGTVWLGRSHYKDTRGRYSTPERNERKKNPYLTFLKSLCTRVCLCSSRTDHLGQSSHHSPCVGTVVALNTLPGPANTLCIHPDFSPRHSWSPYFVAVIQVISQFHVFFPNKLIWTVLSPQRHSQCVISLWVSKWDLCGSFRVMLCFIVTWRMPHLFSSFWFT